MEEEIKENLVFLTENISNLTLVRTYLIRCGIISIAESEDIDAESTRTRKNYKLLSTLQTKDWLEIRNSFLEILRKTSNERCAHEIQQTTHRYFRPGLPQDFFPFQTQNFLLHPKLNKKWWQEKKLLIKSLQERKIGAKLLIDELHDRISKDEHRMLVICETPDASKYSGMGGVGKTLTAKWYAHTYEQEYDHIIWIDCGEGSLLTSFKSLARDLEIPNRNELANVQDYSGKCLDALSAFKCLWIYDNAENYKGEDGIINVLPKDEKNFYCIITSRSRGWGTEKIGFGKISSLELDIFSEEESLKFLKSTLLESIKRTDLELKKLCRLLGNLPLALQLAVAALNNGKIELQNYIEQTSTKDLEFLEEKFDDYEKTINKNINISLDLILQQRNGKLAYEILMIFGYIRPDDIRSIFLMKVLNIDSKKMEEVINLLEEYSLITKTRKVCEYPHSDGIMNKLLRKNEIKIEMYLLSIHRLLQQVIRHNGQKTEMETLKKILGCVGFIDYKFLPFTKYADEELKKQFSKVRAELLDQRQLKKLISEERFEESVELAKFICEELKTQTTKFNLAVCLFKNKQMKESLDILIDLEMEEMMETTSYYKDAMEMGMLELKEELSRNLIWGHLLILHWKMDNRISIKDLLECRQSFTVIYSTDSLGTLIRLVHSDLIKSSYSLVKCDSLSTIELELGEESSKIYLQECSVDLSSFDQLSPEELRLWNVSFNRNGREVEEANVNEFCDFEKINRLILSGDKMSIEMREEISMEYLDLWNVIVNNWNEANWDIQKLELWNIPFVEKTKMKIKEMEFNYSSLDVFCLPPTIEKLHLYSAEVVCNEPIDLPDLKYLTLKWISDTSSLSSFLSVNPTHVHFCHIKEVSVDQLPKSLNYIKITNRDTIVVGGVRKVDKLILEDFSFKQVKQFLGHFQTDELVVSFCDFTAKEFTDLKKREIKKVAVGIPYWDKEWQVTRKAYFNLSDGGKEIEMEDKEFEELIKLY